jgi:hypothetical protein
MVAFTLGTFTRSRRHIFLLLTYIGFATAFAAISVISATVRRTLTLDMPAAYLMALPLVWMFFVAIGLRSAFAIPMEFEANWAFRLVGTQPTDAARAARAAMLALAVLPAAAVMGAVALALGWGVWVASTLAVLDVAWGAVLVQAVAFGWHAVPFARAHRPAVQSVKSRALVVVVPLYVFAFKGADAQFAVLHSARGAAIYVAVVMAACALLAAISRRESRRYGLTFDEDDSEAFTTLSLSDAL